MSKRKLLGLLMVFVGLGIMVGFIAFRRLFPPPVPLAGLKVESVPRALVFVNHQEAGLTPLEKEFPPGEVTVRLVPAVATSSPDYTTKLSLTAGTYTVIRRDMGLSETDSCGEIVSLRPQADRTAAINIISLVPDTIAVEMDGQPKGYSPLLIDQLGAGDHFLGFSSPGFAPRSLNLKTVPGYVTTINVKLSSLPIPAQAASASALIRPYVQILSTPTGFLRVRSGSDPSASEIGRIYPGDKYPFLGENSGWYLIGYDALSTSSAWISSQYAKIFP